MQHMKLTAITLSIKGVKKTAFVQLPVNARGKVVMTQDTLAALLLALFGIQDSRGITIAIG